jgi:DNA adenine methylase
VDFTEIEVYAHENSFVYFDPPYRPISRTANFRSYIQGGFNDDEQRRLAESFQRMNQQGARLLLSNSDPHNSDPGDDFFDELYRGFWIERVPAIRRINSQAGKRGAINELLIRNYSLTHELPHPGGEGSEKHPTG